MNYQKIYDAIIVKARLRDEIECYCEIHHIIPKSLGGLDTPENLVKLTYKEHYLCHRLLPKIYPEEKSMHYAFWMMSGRSLGNNLHISARAYSDAKESILFCKKGTTLSEETKAKISKSKKQNPCDFWIGKEHTEESKQKMSESAKHRNITEENEQIRRDGISKAHKGRSLSTEHIKHISEAKIGDKNGMFGKTGKDNARSKVVTQYSLNNEFIKEWDNAGIAATELGISYTGIRNCVTGKTKTSGKFIWKEK